MLSQQQQSGNLPRVVGIVGLGGVGKSTLAKEFFNRHRSDYVRHCFVSDVRENAAKNSLNSLQSILLKDLASSDTQINTVDEGIGKLKRYLSSCQRALLVLDNVDHVDQLDALFSPVKDTIHPDSLILVTSRNRDVLISSDIPESSIYRLTGLNRQHSRKLFCSHAFGPSHSLEGFEKVIDQFLDACQGLPLSLKVVGALVRGKRDLNHWKAQLRKISKILPEDIQSTLKISYDSLEEWNKQIFLDIACFFIGEDKDSAIRTWNGSGWEGGLGLWTLENRCLVDVDSEKCIRMHDHLRDLGRDLAEKENPGCRLWQPTDKLLRDISGLAPVRGISMDHLEQSFENLVVGHLFSTDMSSLQLLRGEGYFVERVLSVGHLLQLKYLHWDNCLSSSFASSIPIQNLRVLYLEGQYLETLWNHESQAPLQLRELHIHSELLNIIPNSIGKLKHLEKLVFCSVKLETLTDSVGNLTSLQSLALPWCSALQMLPDSVGKLTSLHSLELQGCSALQMLPESVGQMRSLRSLDLSECSTLRVLPDSVGQMTSLQRLHLGKCSALQMLPDSVGQLTKLQSLQLGSCSGLQMLPDSVGQMTNLQSLQLGSCSALKMLPDSIGQMRSLQNLELCFCSALKMLPDSFGKMTNLQLLDLLGCHALQMLPDSVGQMKSLQFLYLVECSALETLPDSVGGMTSLQKLDLGGCSALQTLPDSVGEMTSLQKLDLGGCSALQTLPDSVGEIASLESLYLHGCSALQSLPISVGKLSSLQTLDLGRCSSLQMLPDTIRMLTQLKELTITDMHNLEWFEEEDCGSSELASQNVGGDYPHLQHLIIYDSHFVKDQALPSTLVKLELIYCTGLCKIRGLCDLVKLQTLTITGCKAVEELLNIETLISLDVLTVRSCYKLKRLFELTQLSKLRILVVQNCYQLEELPGVEHLSSLEILHVSRCPKVQWGAGVVEQLRQRLGKRFLTETHGES